jgi:FtsH-binding integral membrane protein
MSMYPNSRPVELDYGRDDRAIASFFNAVYAWMAVGLAVTAAVAYLVAQNTALLMTFNSRGIAVALLLGAWGLAYGVRSAALRLSAAAAIGLFLVYSALIGALMSYIFILYPIAKIGGAFVLTAGTFGIMSVYGYVTKADLTRIGSFLVMAAIGLFVASLVNIFFFTGAGAFSWFLTYAILAVFIGLTAYHTQQLKNIAYDLQGQPDLAGRYAIIGSLILYISFINMFSSIMRILGNRR